jgi:hypothetical protein
MELYRKLTIEDVEKIQNIEIDGKKLEKIYAIVVTEYNKTLNTFNNTILEIFNLDEYVDKYYIYERCDFNLPILITTEAYENFITNCQINPFQL